MFDIGGTESLVIVLAILLLFGAKRIPDIARSFGSGIREFRRAMREINDEVQAAGALTDEPRRIIRPAVPAGPPETPHAQPGDATVPPPPDRRPEGEAIP